MLQVNFYMNVYCTTFLISYRILVRLWISLLDDLQNYKVLLLKSSFCLTLKLDAVGVMQVKTMNGKVLNKRTLKVSIAEDNGRAKEFIRRRVTI